MKIYVGGLTENLATLSEADLRQLFSPFGDIVTVDLHKDPYTGIKHIADNRQTRKNWNSERTDIVE